MPTGTLTFAVGETSQTITVNVPGDTVTEPNEAFTVSPRLVEMAISPDGNPALNDDDFAAALVTAQEEFDEHKPQLIVESSRGCDESRLARLR